MGPISSPTIEGLYAIVDNSYCPALDHVTLARQFLAGGARLLQLRIKGIRDRKYFRRVAAGIMALKAEFPFTFIVNDDVRLALELGADGVHGGSDDMPIARARACLGPQALVGYSAHSLAEVQWAEQEGANYVAFGAIFPTELKPPDHPIQGLEKLAQAVASVSIPVVAIGGIHRANIRQVLETGVAAVAMIGGITKAPDIARETQWYCKVLL